ncbi:MAG: enoyl-CoA hydratase/isomerase family protein, partial [Saprospiraceae bacterium]
MEYQTLLTEYKDGICIITINREKALNALNRTVFAELRTYFSEEGPARNDLSGVIITGAGSKAFVAGADIKEFDGLDVEKAKALSKNGHEVFDLIENFDKPVIAAVNGFALGGGCELTMACHLRIAGAKARFGQPEVNLGIIPGYGGTQRLVQLVGKGKALELLMTADMIGAEEAHRLGLVNHVVEPGEEVNKSKEILQKIASKAPLAIAKTIDCVNAY